MKYLLILCTLFLCSCHYQHTDGDVYDSNGDVTFNTTIRDGDLIFYVKEKYQYGNGYITTTVVNNSPNYVYNFNCELQLWQNGFIVESSGMNYIYDLFPGQAQDCCYICTRYTINDQLVRIVVTNVTKIHLNTPQ